MKVEFHTFNDGVVTIEKLLHTEVRFDGARVILRNLTVKTDKGTLTQDAAVLERYFPLAAAGRIPELLGVWGESDTSIVIKLDDKTVMYLGMQSKQIDRPNMIQFSPDKRHRLEVHRTADSVTLIRSLKPIDGKSWIDKMADARDVDEPAEGAAPKDREAVELERLLGLDDAALETEVTEGGLKWAKSKRVSLARELAKKLAAA